MKTFSVVGPNGKTYSITVPENATNEQIRLEILRVYQEANPDYAPMGAPGDREPPAAPPPRVAPPQEASKVDPRSIVGGTTASMYDIVPEDFAYGKPPVRDEALEAAIAAINRNRELNPDFGGPVIDVLGGASGALLSKLLAGKPPTALEQLSANRAAFDQTLKNLQTSPLNAVASSQSQIRGEPTLPGFVPQQSASATPEFRGGTPGEKWASKVVGDDFIKPGVRTVTEAAADYRRSIPKGKISGRLYREHNLPHIPGVTLWDQLMARSEAREQAALAAQQAAHAEQQQANRDQRLAEERFRQATKSAQGIAPAPGTYRGALQRYPGFLGGLAGAGGAELMQQAAQYQAEGDPVGAAIAAGLAGGTTIGVLPYAPARAIGMGTGAISPLVLYLYDKMRDRGSVMDGR